MKIVLRKQLMALQAGTVWSYYEPCVFTGLFIKESGDEPQDFDFVITDLIGAVENTSSDDWRIKCEEMEKGKSLPTDFESSGREGLFDDQQLFAIYETEDVKKLIQKLQKTLIT